MKPLIFLVASIVLAMSFARAVEVPSPDSKALAFGYAAAFACMNKSSVAILYLNGGQVETIKDVSQITAYGGTLLIKGYAGSRQILDAGRVVKIAAD